MTKSGVLREFAEKNHKEWKELFIAEELTLENEIKIRQNLPSRVFSTDVDLVVFGSIARNECTSKSDVDWTLLVDGQANADHKNMAHLIENAIVETGLAKPGKTGMFGQTTFSHDLIHNIGGEKDTNHNISRRILLLLESDRIPLNKDDETSGTAYDRVIRGIIQQYIDNDSGFSASTGKEYVPRFLLNDIVRFWRTMCVDFAYKQREDRGEKWALRNIKLRMSRKLIYVKGLLMCYKSFRSGMDKEDIKQQLRQSVATKPLEFITSVLLEQKIANGYIISLLDTYNDFLRILNDEAFRKDLNDLEMDKVYGNEKFEEARENSHKFQEALTQIFIVQDSLIKDFTLKYGVF